MAFRLLATLKAAELVTSVTSEENQTLQRKPLLGLAVTCVTSVTLENIATFNLDRDTQGRKPDLAQTIGECAFSDITDVTGVTALQGNGLSCNVIGKADVTDVTAALADPENQSAETWLADRLSTGVQIADALHREGALLGFTIAEMEAAPLAIGGFLWWPAADATLKLPPKIAPVEQATNLDSAREALQSFALELGFDWSELQGPGFIDAGELAYAAQNWSLHSEAEWRGYVDSIGARALHNCRGLAFRPLCDCGGACRALGA